MDNKNNDRRILEEVNNKTLNKNEFRELIDIVSQNKIGEKIKDSLTILMFDRINSPLSFDSIHKSYNHQQAPNLKNPNPTLDEWNAYNGNTQMWQQANVDYFLYEFGLIGKIDGFEGVILSLQNSKHGNSINFQYKDFDGKDFKEQMSELNKDLVKTSRLIVTIDTSVFIINQSDLKRFTEIMEKLEFGKITTYNSK